MITNGNRANSPDSSAKISLCMIVKDEEKDIRRCLESARGFVDEMVVVDTGSLDKTVDVAREFGARVFFLPWQNDFSLARNFALAQAKFDWILILDADDELQWQGVNKRELLQLDFDIYICRIVNCVGSPLFQRETVHPQPRLFRRTAAKEYCGALHEQLVYEDGVKIAVAPLSVIHYGYFDARKDRGSRNIAILQTQVNKEPGNLFARYNLATERLRQGHTDQAVKVFAQLFPRVDEMGTGLVAEFVRSYAVALLNGENYEKALEIVAWGKNRFPQYTDLVSLEAKVYYHLGDWVKASKLFQRCLEMGESPVYFCTAQGVGTRLPWVILGDIHNRSGNYHKAVDCFVRALSYNQEDISPLLKLAIAASRKFRGPGVIEEIGKYCSVPHEYWKYVIQTLLEVGEIEGARSLLNKVGHLGSGHDYYGALVEFAAGENCKARLEKALESTADREDLQAIASQLCICCWLEQDWLGGEKYLQLLQGSLARVYNSYHRVLTAGETTPLILEEDFQLVLHLVRQALYAKSLDLAQKACSLWELRLTPLQAVQLMETLLRFGAFQWAVELMEKQGAWKSAEVSFLYGKALLACGQAGPAVTLFKNLAAGQPGFIPAYLGLLWGNLALAYAVDGGPDENRNRFTQQLDHWLRTGCLIN